MEVGACGPSCSSDRSSQCTFALHCGCLEKGISNVTCKKINTGEINLNLAVPTTLWAAVLISCAYVSASWDNRLTDRNTVTTICRSSVFQSVSELATSLSLSLSSIELLGDECEGIFMYVCNGWFFLYAWGFLSALVQSFPTICLFLLLNMLFCVLPVHQLLESTCSFSI